MSIRFSAGEGSIAARTPIREIGEFQLNPGRRTGIIFVANSATLIVLKSLIYVARRDQFSPNVAPFASHQLYDRLSTENVAKDFAANLMRIIQLVLVFWHLIFKFKTLAKYGFGPGHIW